MYMKTYSVAAARSSLPRLLDQVGRGGVVQISRRGKTVALLVPPGEYLGRTEGGRLFHERLQAWRADHPAKDSLNRKFVASLRDRSESGR
jgi:antitoxin (DNA-binding transcriptional repressor) of toxin-antitoxin stability system